MNISDNFETVVVDTDILILGGGMAACGAAFNGYRDAYLLDEVSSKTRSNFIGVRRPAHLKRGSREMIV